MSIEDPGAEWWEASMRVGLVAVFVGIFTVGGGRVAIALMHDGLIAPETLAPWRPAVIAGGCAMLVLTVLSLALFARYAYLSNPKRQSDQP